MSARRRRIGAGAAVAAVLGLAAWTRLNVWPRVFGSGELLPQFDSDSAYHLHRILATLARFPDVPTFDPWMNWPRGGLCPWADGFDLAAASLALLAGGAGSPRAAAVVIAAFPVALGLAVVAAAMVLARRVAGRRPGVVVAAGLLAGLMPTAVLQSALGRIDHHVFEALLVALLAIWTLDAPPAGASRARRVRFEACGALVATVGLYGFTGATLYVALATAVVLVAVLARPGPQPLVGSGAPALAAASAASALLAAPAISEHHLLLSFQFPSLLQPALYLVAAGGLGLAVAVTRLRPSAPLARRVVACAAAGVAIAAALAVALPGLRREVASGISGWLLHEDAWLREIVEFQPMLRSNDGRPWWVLLHGFLGWSGFFVVIALPLAAWWVARRQGRGPALALAAQAAALVVLTFVQTRFARVAVPLVAVSVACALGALADLAAARRRTFARRRELAVVLAVAALLLVDPPSRAQLFAPRRAGPDPYQAAAIDLRGAGPVEPGRRPGVAVGWTWGHWFEALGGRPVVANGFGTYLDADSFWELDRALHGTPAELEALMARRDLGYVVYGAITASGDDRTLPFEALRRRPLGPLVIGGSGVPQQGTPHLAHFLPRFASRQVVAGLGHPVPALWTYELVPGARLVGAARAGTRVVAELPFDENGRKHQWRAWADAGSDGRFEIVVPVPSGWKRAAIETGAAWSVRAAGERVELVVSESAVRAGAVLQVPKFEER